MGQAKNLAKGLDGPGQSKSGTRQARRAKIRDGTWNKRNKMGQSRKGSSKAGKLCSKTEKEKDVLKRENDV